MDRPAPHVLTADPATCLPADLAPAAAWLGSGGIVAFPTDTFYGLAVDPASATAVEALFDLKGRGADAALPIVAASLAQARMFCPAMNALTLRLAEAFWPGPLSLVCDAPANVAPAVHGGRNTVAIRVPSHRVAQALAAAWGAPVTATSANRSGEAPARTALEARAFSRDPRVLLIGAGDAPGGSPSTIVDAREEPPRLIRAGAIAWDRVLRSR